MSCRKRYKIEKKVREHNRKVRREKKKNPGKSKIKINLGLFFLGCTRITYLPKYKSEQYTVISFIPVENMFNFVHD
jgi:hypothetical protein